MHAAVYGDWSACIAPGETARVIIVAVDKGQARIVRSYAEAILRSDPDLEPLIAGTDQESPSLPTCHSFLLSDIVPKTGLEFPLVIRFAPPCDPM